MYVLPLVWWMSMTPPWTPMMYARVAAMSLATFSLVGCGTTKPITVTKIEYVKVYVNPTFTQPVQPPALPAVNDYMALSLVEREHTLTQYSIGLMKNLAQCNSQLSSIQRQYGAPSP